MSEVVGRAGFHATHTKNISERRPILHEMMRELDEESIAYWATRNASIVIEDEVLNEALVNDGSGGFLRCTDRQQVLDYGDERVAHVKRKFRDDKFNPKTKKMQGGTVTTTLIVAHLPKSMCVEIPDFYPVFDKKTGDPVLKSDGTLMKRSRWVARDRDEARRYFMDVVGILERDAIPGGHGGVLGVDIQHSESTPHVQILADTFAPDPDDPDALRVESSRAWFSHRDVRDESGRQKGGRTKLSGYHAGLKSALIAKGYDISPDFDEVRHMTGYTKDDYERVEDQKRENAERAAALDLADQQVKAEKTKLAGVSKHVSDKIAALPKLREAAIAQGRLDAQQEVADDRWAAYRARTDAEAARTQARTHEARLQLLRDQIERDLQQAGPAPHPPSYEDMRGDIFDAQSSVVMRFLRSTEFRDGSTLFDRFESYAKAEFAKHQQRERDALGRYGGARFETWLERTVAAQRRIDRATLVGPADDIKRRGDGQEHVAER